MTIKHHLPDATLLGYSAGTLPEAFNLIVAAHVSLCDACRAGVESYDALGGALLNEANDSSMAPTSLETALRRLDDTRAPTPTTQGGVFPAALQDYVGGDLASVKWRAMGMGVKQAVLPTSSAATARLLMIPEGAAMPDHTHNGTEMTLVLQGAFDDADGHFARGDIDVADAAVTHTPVASKGADCICLVVTDAPLRFTAWLPRVLQRIIGI